MAMLVGVKLSHGCLAGLDSTPAIADDTFFTDATFLLLMVVWCRLALSRCFALTLRSSPRHPATPDLHHSFDQPLSCRFQVKLQNQGSRALEL